MVALARSQVLSLVASKDGAAAAVAEYVDALVAVRALQVAHVFDYAQDRDLNLFEHVDGFARIFEGDCGWRGDNDGAGYGGGLEERELDVAGAGREVDQ